MSMVLVWRVYHEGRMDAFRFLRELFKACESYGDEAGWLHALAWIDGMAKDAELDVEDAKFSESNEEGLSYLYGRLHGFKEAYDLFEEKARKGKEASWGLFNEIIESLIMEAELDVEILDAELEAAEYEGILENLF